MKEGDSVHKCPLGHGYLYTKIDTKECIRLECGSCSYYMQVKQNDEGAMFTSGAAFDIVALPSEMFSDPNDMKGVLTFNPNNDINNDVDEEDEFFDDDDDY